MAKLTYRQIEAFRAVMISGTTSGAADILCVSQPAVSRLISDFEDTVGVSMFERQKKRLVPTPEAQVFYAEVERSFVSLEKLMRAADDLRGFHLGSLRIASMPAVSLEFVPAVIQQFSQDNLGVSLSFQIRSTQQVADLVASQQFDLGIVSAIPLADAALRVEPLADSRMVCVMPSNHRLAEQEVIRPQDLDGENFISMGVDQSLRHKIDSVFDSAGVKRQLNIDTQLSYGACGFVQSGMGVSLVDPITALHYQKLGVVARRFEPRIAYRYNLIFPAHRTPSALTKAFVKLLKARLTLLSKSSAGVLTLDH
ncbi:DNA-binding transcriptional regulator, LysR family [Oceanospirillum multiglobuliferum]|uniref:LysR family transcriptional regulator n=1 Tax=Oceanospirillum multiglobuliferum TaxID=64969 RepID=A0A1T4PIV5_9GAMM|nr:LysR substrate-binding domain-containing protein [Oceanospirillum multiglobuliferum]OPX55535.1 LysR family transcriptional regulator [Oceanospirillum multiglobuliferum]SJZ91237.1 DNA-binding transcriptional regulator, LysR family [Oceanospirillum multiglobuliferum]